MTSCKITGGTNISPLISSVILASMRLSVDKRKLVSDGIKKSASAPKDILKKTISVFDISKFIKNKTTKPKTTKPKTTKPKTTKPKTTKPKTTKPKTTKPKTTKPKITKPKMKGGGSKEFFE
jgi:carbohydrate-binding DOMON domain-containing protein